MDNPIPPLRNENQKCQLRDKDSQFGWLLPLGYSERTRLGARMVARDWPRRESCRIHEHIAAQTPKMNRSIDITDAIGTFATSKHENMNPLKN
mmetsp:Transcript_1180/g.2465  ORF Transcript_1180/g.2465 Transcript_1180/m.2465 type:complete len:93 (+) Transcript_1180:102-380(+)